MKNEKISWAKHIKNLIFFNFNRFKSDNYSKMREYLADVFLIDIQNFAPLKGKNILDVGGANGEFCKTISKKVKCNMTNVDPYPKDIIWKKTVRGFADKMPFKDDSFDVVLFRGVLEHIPYEKQQPSLNEIFRVMKDGGIGYFVIPPWFNPHAGHNFKPFHILPFKVAKFLREAVFREKVDENPYTGKKVIPTCYEDYFLFKITFRKMQKMIKSAGFEIVDTLDTHFRLHFMTKIPLLREILVPSAAFIVRKPKDEPTH